MSLRSKIRGWLGIKPMADAEREHREIRALVHEARNIATNAVAESRKLGQAASQAEHATREAIRRLEAAKRERNRDDRMAHPP